MTKTTNGIKFGKFEGNLNFDGEQISSIFVDGRDIGSITKEADYVELGATTSSSRAIAARYRVEIYDMTGDDDIERVFDVTDYVIRGRHLQHVERREGVSARQALAQAKAFVRDHFANR